MQLLLNYIEHSEAPHYSEVCQYLKSTSIVSESVPKRRLSALSDYEGKTRVIAIGDYISNMLLKPLHDELMKCIKGIKPDYTHKQHRLSEVVINDFDEPTSVDITAASDRIPVELTETVISEYFDSKSLGKA